MRLIYVFLLVSMASSTLAFAQEAPTSFNLPVMEFKDGKPVLKTVTGFQSSDGVMSKTFELGSKGTVENGNIDGRLPASMLDLLNRQNGLIRELELSDDQQQTVTEMLKAQRKSISDLVTQLPLGQTSDYDKASHMEAIRESIESANERLEDVLVPWQVERVRELLFRNLVKQHGLANVLTSKQFADRLSIDDLQARKIDQKAKHIEQELEDKIAKLKAAADKELLGELNANQRRRVKELMGSPAEKKPAEVPAKR